MAARKNKAPKTSSEEARAFVVVLEEIRAQNKVFGEGQQLLHEQQQTLRQEQQMLRQEMSAGFAEVHRRFQEVDLRFEAVDRRFDRVEHDIAEIRQDVGLVKIAVLDHARELKEVRVALEKKVDRDEVEGIVHRVIARSG
jgi:type I site-specific restriction endonuclease